MRPKRVAGDKGYSYPRVRKWLRDHGIGAVIPEKDDPRLLHPANPRGFDKETYRRRSIIEQCIGWLKECRRIGTRFEKLAINFLAMVKLAMIHRYLRFSFSDRA
jgi:transposase